MAKDDRIGALYYEVILDPEGFARGSSKVRSDQKIMAEAIKVGTTEMEKLQAKLDAIGKMAVNASEKERQLLGKLQADILKRMEEIADGKDEAIAKEKELARVRKQEAQAEAARKKKQREDEQRLESVRTANDLRYLKRMATSGNLWRDRIKVLSVVERRLDGVNGGLSKLAGNLAQAAGFSPAMQGLARALGQVGLKWLAYGFAIAGSVKLMSAAARANDQYSVGVGQLTAMLGGQRDRAVELTTQMNRYAAATSFSGEETRAFAAQMIALGKDANEVLPALELLGPLSMGDPARLKLITKAYADVINAGRLRAQEANQFINSEIPIWEALSETMGMTQQQVRDLTEEGKVSADHVVAALQHIHEVRGGAAVLEERQNSIVGQLDEMKAHWERIKVVIGGPVQKAVVSVLKVINWILDKMADVTEFFQPWIDKINLLFLGPMQWLESAQVTADKIMKITATGPYDTRVQDEKDLQEHLKRMAEDQNRIFKERQAIVDEMTEELEDQLRTEEEKYQLKLDQLVEEEKITEEQAKQLMDKYKSVEATKDQVEATKELAREEERRRKAFEQERDRMNKQLRTAQDKNLTPQQIAVRDVQELQKRFAEGELTAPEAKELFNIRYKQLQVELAMAQAEQAKKDAEEKKRVSEIKRKQQVDKALAAVEERIKEREEKMTEIVNRRFETMSGSVGATGGAIGGEDYKFVAQRQAEQRKWLEEKKRDDLRNQMLKKIRTWSKKTADAARDQAELMKKAPGAI